MSVLREVHPIPKVDEILGQLAGATVFSKLDANSRFWQVPLAKELRLLTTFIMPTTGRYRFNKLPFRISSAPEVFQKRMQNIIEGLDGVLCLIDYVPIFGANRAEHYQRLMATLERIEATCVTLNKRKRKFYQTSVNFLGHVTDEQGIHPDPAKTAAIVQMQDPNNITELCRFMGMVNRLGKLSPNIAMSQPQ